MLNIDLTGHLALVTGGTGQLGRVMVRTLAEAGAGVVVHYHRDEKQARALLETLNQLGVPNMAVKADVTDRKEVQRMQAEIQKKLGSPDIIVNNAVIQYRWTSVLEQSEEDYESQFRSCVLHNVNMAKVFVPAMKQKRWGRVIAINTECAMQNAPTQSAYVSGKRGMDGVLRVLAKEIGEYQVTVNQVAPGWMVTEESPERASDEAYLRTVPLKRRGHDQDIANLVTFLASDLAGFITGQFISVSGGNVMPTI